MIRLTIALFFLIAVALAADTNLTIHELHEMFGPGWEAKWKERHFTDFRNRFQVVREGDNPVLRIDSSKSASGMWRTLDVQPVLSGTVSWRWKVEKSLTQNRNETEKSGDDYAARVFVVFEPHFFRWKTRSVCYVWAGNEPRGNFFRSPYSGSVGTVVLQSGDENAGKWIMERRDFVSDYRSFFGRDPEQVSAVAIMVDTDNTGDRTRAWFDDIRLRVNGAANAAEKVHQDP